MKIGVSAVINSGSMDVAELARWAEELGFDSFWLPEHPVIPAHTTSRYGGTPDGSIPPFMADLADPFIGLAMASAGTTRIRLGTAVCLAPEHHPLVQAKQIAALDYHSGGRFLFGVGAGWLREETEIMGGDFDHRWTQTREAIEVMKALWTQDEAEYHGRYYDFPALKVFPKPAQKTASAHLPGRRRPQRLPPRSGLRRRLDAGAGHAGGRPDRPRHAGRTGKVGRPGPGGYYDLRIRRVRPGRNPADGGRRGQHGHGAAGNQRPQRGAAGAGAAGGGGAGVGGRRDASRP